MKYRYLFLSVFIVALFLIPAIAQVQVEPPVSKNDFSPLINQLIGVGILMATGVLSLVGMKIRAYFAAQGILTDEKIKDARQMAFNQAALLALGLFESLYTKATGAAKIDWAAIDLANPFLREAAQWMMKAWPEATEGMSLDDVLKSLFARIPSGPMALKAVEFAQAKAAGVAIVATVTNGH